MQSFQTAIFDLDGTLVDSMWIWETVITRSLEKRNIPPDKSLEEKFRDMTFTQSAQFVVEAFHINETPQALMDDWNSIIFDDYKNHIRLKPGAYEYIKKLKNQGIKLAIATSNFKEAVEAVLSSNGVWADFSFVITSDEIGKNKSFPDIYLSCAKALNTLPENCMVFEDILLACSTAKKAGMQVTGVYDQMSAQDRSKMEELCNRYIVSFEELLLE